MVEYAPNLEETTGLQSENYLKQLRVIEQTLDQVLTEGRRRQRAAEDVELQKGIERDREARAEGEKNVQGQTREYHFPEGRTPVGSTREIYRTAPEQRDASGKVTHHGAFSNIGVIPGRTYGDFRKEREFERQLELAGVKEGGKKTAYDEATIKEIDNLSKQKAEIDKAEAGSAYAGMTPEQRAKSVGDIETKIQTLKAQMVRSMPSRQTTGAPKGYKSYIDSVPQETGKTETKQASPEIPPYEPGPHTPPDMPPEGSTATNPNTKEKLIIKGGQWVKMEEPQTNVAPESDMPANEDFASIPGYTGRIRAANAAVPQTVTPTPSTEPIQEPQAEEAPNLAQRLLSHITAPERGGAFPVFMSRFKEFMNRPSQPLYKTLLEMANQMSPEERTIALKRLDEAVKGTPALYGPEYHNLAGYGR